MATSGSIDWAATRDDIIEGALIIVGAIEEDETPRAPQVSVAARTLNRMIKGWQTTRTPLWKTEWQTATMTASSEVLGYDDSAETTINYTCIKPHEAASTNRPVSGVDWTTYWKVGGSVGITWVTATDYTAIGQLPLSATGDILGITEAFWRNDSTDTPMWIISREEYFEQSDKGTRGIPNKLYLDMTTIGTATVFLWPQPDVDITGGDLSQVLHFNAITRLEDFDSPTDNPDFDVMWIDALTYNLAYKLCHGYGLPLKERLLLKEEAKELKALADNGSEEQLDMTLHPREE